MPCRLRDELLQSQPRDLALLLGRNSQFFLARVCQVARSTIASISPALFPVAQTMKMKPNRAWYSSFAAASRSRTSSLAADDARLLLRRPRRVPRPAAAIRCTRPGRPTRRADPRVCRERLEMVDWSKGHARWYRRPRPSPRDSATDAAPAISRAQRSDPQQRRSSLFGGPAVERVQLVKLHAAGACGAPPVLMYPRLSEQPQPPNAAVRKNVEPHVRHLADRLHVVVEGVTDVRLQRAPRHQLAPLDAGAGDEIGRRAFHRHASRLQAPGAFPLKWRVSTSTRLIVPGAPRRTIVQSWPGPRRRLVSQPSPMLRASPGMIRLCRDPKNMSLHATTMPPCSAAARSTSPAPPQAVPVGHDVAVDAQPGDAAVGEDPQSDMRGGDRGADREQIVRVAGQRRARQDLDPPRVAGPSDFSRTSGGRFATSIAHASG